LILSGRPLPKDEGDGDQENPEEHPDPAMVLEPIHQRHALQADKDPVERRQHHQEQQRYSCRDEDRLLACNPAVVLDQALRFKAGLQPGHQKEP
jgi:hypothetical protein